MPGTQNNRLYFCADLGTSSLKAALIDNTGRLHGFARVPFNNECADTWLSAFLEAAEKLASKKIIPPDKGTVMEPVSAIVISGSGPTLVPVKGSDPVSSESLRPVYWYDPVPLAADSSYNSSSFFLPKLKAFIETQPEIFAGVQYFFSPEEWLSWKLGARPVTVLPHNAYIPYYWDDEVCGRFGIKRDVFPPFVVMGSTIGELNYASLTKESSVLAKKNSTLAKLLPPGIPIIAGASDFIMAIIGTGTLDTGTICDRTGSSEGINLCVSSPPEHSLADRKSGELRILPHALPGLWNLGVVIRKSGKLFDEFRIENGLESKSYNELVREILGDISHKGRPVLESIGSSFVKALNTVENLGYSVTELVLSGGQCADPLWNQYKADLSERILKVPEIIHAELAGNAVLCEAAFSGKSIRETATAMIRIKETYRPGK